MRTSLAAFAIAAMVVTNTFAADAAMPSHPLAECREGGDFIRNAAVSRDNGITREFFMSRLAGDLMAIRSFPPELRWFARNEDDEALLTNAAANVFDQLGFETISTSDSGCCGALNHHLGAENE